MPSICLFYIATQNQGENTLQIEVSDDVYISKILCTGGQDLPAGTPLVVLVEEEEDIERAAAAAANFEDDEKQGRQEEEEEEVELSWPLWQAYVKEAFGEGCS